jgi:hypothetical protein
MCNCLTLDFPKTYTAFALTVDRFLKQVEPGKTIVLSYSELREKNEKIPRAWKIPKKINTFLFSPFNEAYHTMFDCGDGIMSSCVGRKARKLSKRVQRYTPFDLADLMKGFDKKIDRIWGKVLKILVLYDNTWSDNNIKFLMNLYDQAVAMRVGGYWPIIRVKSGKATRVSKPNRSSLGPWFHYTDKAKKAVIEEIKALEKTWANNQ